MTRLGRGSEYRYLRELTADLVVSHATSYTMVKLVPASFTTAIVLFLWGFLFWATPLPYTQLPTSPDDATLTSALSTNLPQSGTYLLPSPLLDDDERMRLQAQGPTAMLFFRSEGTPSIGVTMALGFLHMWITALALALLTKLLLRSLPRFWKRVMTITLIGVIVVFWSRIGPVIWWHHPADFQLITSLYDLGSWFLAGLITSMFIKP